MYSHPEIPPGTPEKRRIPDPRPGLWRRFRAWRWVLTGSLLIAGLYTVLSWQTGRLVLKTWSAWNTVMENYGARVAGERIEKGMFFSRIDADLVRRGGEQAPLHMETRIYHYPGFDRQGGLALFHFSMAFTGPGTGGAGTVTFRGRYYYDDHFVIDLHAPARGFSPAAGWNVTFPGGAGGRTRMSAEFRHAGISLPSVRVKGPGLTILMEKVRLSWVLAGEGDQRKLELGLFVEKGDLFLGQDPLMVPLERTNALLVLVRPVPDVLQHLPGDAGDSRRLLQDWPEGLEVRYGLTTGDRYGLARFFGRIAAEDTSPSGPAVVTGSVRLPATMVRKQLQNIRPWLVDLQRARCVSLDKGMYAMDLRYAGGKLQVNDRNCNFPLVPTAGSGGGS